MHSSHHWRGEREGSEGDKIGRSKDPEQPDGREGTAMLGTKTWKRGRVLGRDRRPTTPPRTKREVASLHKSYKIKNLTSNFKKFSRGAGATDGTKDNLALGETKSKEIRSVEIFEANYL